MLNGFGDRLSTVEREQTASRERDTQWLLSLERLTTVNTQLVKEVGKATASADACERDMLEATQDIRLQISDLARSVEGRMASVETELRLMREKH